MEKTPFSNPLPDAGAQDTAKAPVLWALVALAYLCEIGAIAVIINTMGEMRLYAGFFAMGFPMLAMAGVIFIRTQFEHLFYISPKHPAEGYSSSKLIESWIRAQQAADRIKPGDKS